MKRRTNLTIDPKVFALAQEVMRLRHFSDFSGFIEQIIREEHERKFNRTAPAEVQDWLRQQGFLQLNETLVSKPISSAELAPEPTAVPLNQPSSTPQAPTALQAADLALRKVTSSGKPDKPTRAK